MDWLHALVGASPEAIVWWQMVIRAVIIFFFLLVLVRIAGHRAFGQAPFDIVLGILLGSTLSRALTANAPFVPTLAASAALVALHVLIAAVAMHSPRIARLAKGHQVQLFRYPEFLGANLRRNRVTESDVREQLRSSMQQKDLDDVAEAWLERSGDVSFIRRQSD